MKELLTLFLIIFCSCPSYAQLPVIPVPTPGTLGTYGTYPTPHPPSDPVTSFMRRSPEINVYNPNEQINRKRQAQQEIDEAYLRMREMKERQDIAFSLIQHGFPSQSETPGTEYFHSAYQEISSMLGGSVPLNLERAIFLVENAYLSNQLNFDDFQKSISEKVDYCKWRMKELKLNLQEGLALNMTIFSLLTDTLNIQQPGTENTITHYPLKYNLDDYDSQKDFTSHFITTLLTTNVGQCYSMPLLYLVLAERLGAKACLSLAPHHSFVKIQDDKGAWYNLELYETRLTLEIAHLLNIRNPEILKKTSPEAYKHYERMHELYKEIDDSGYEDMPKEIYARWLQHVEKLKKEESSHPQPVMRKTIK